MNKRIVIGFFLLLVLFVSACENVDLNKVSKEDIDKVIVCEKPYIRFASTCCLDQNNNKICDKDEVSQKTEVAEKQIEKESSPTINTQETPQEQKIEKQEEVKEIEYGILLEDTFSNDNTEKWLEVVDDWQVINGQYYTSMIGGFTGEVGFVMAGDLSWRDYTLEFDFIPSYSATEHGNVIGVYIMAQKTSPYSFSGYASSIGYDKTATIAKYENGKPKDLIKIFNENFGFNSSTTYNVKLQKIGKDIKLKVWEKGSQEPEWQLTAQDDKFNSGYIAFDTWNTKMSIDNVKVIGTGKPITKMVQEVEQTENQQTTQITAKTDINTFIKNIKPVSSFNYCNCIPSHAGEMKTNCEVCRLFQSMCYKNKDGSKEGCSDLYKLNQVINCVGMNDVRWWYKENSCDLAPNS